MKPLAVMISHHTRADNVRELTLAELKKVNITPRVFTSHAERGSDAEVKRMAWNALSTTQGHKGGALFFEDDLIIDARRMTWFLAQPHTNHDLIILCLLRSTIYPPEHQKRMTTLTPTPLQIVPLDHHAFSSDRGFHGSMAMWLSKDLINRLTLRKTNFMTPDNELLTIPMNPSERKRHKVCGFDFWLKDFALSPATVFPNPVDHRTIESTIRATPGVFKSPSYPVPHE